MSEATHRFFRKIMVALALLPIVVVISPAQADSPGRAITAQFEMGYPTAIINHHYAAPRITELAAGADVQRNAPLKNPQEGISPTSKAPATPSKASTDEVKSMARLANRMQGEEILTAQRFLKQWYGVEHAPQLMPEVQQQIQLLEQTAAGEQFNRLSYRLGNRQHSALAPGLDCRVKADIQHEPLKNYCNAIVHAQTMEINDMR